MALATGGSAVGAIRIRSSPISCAFRTAAGVGMISTDPSGKTARTSRTRIASFTFSRTLGLRGGKFLGGIIERYTSSVQHPESSIGPPPRKNLIILDDNKRGSVEICEHPGAEPGSFLITAPAS